MPPLHSTVLGQNRDTPGGGPMNTLLRTAKKCATAGVCISSAATGETNVLFQTSIPLGSLAPAPDPLAWNFKGSSAMFTTTLRAMYAGPLVTGCAEIGEYEFSKRLPTSRRLPSPKSSSAALSYDQRTSLP